MSLFGLRIIQELPGGQQGMEECSNIQDISGEGKRCVSRGSFEETGEDRTGGQLSNDTALKSATLK